MATTRPVKRRNRAASRNPLATEVRMALGGRIDAGLEPMGAYDPEEMLRRMRRAALGGGSMAGAAGAPMGAAFGQHSGGSGRATIQRRVPTLQERTRALV